MVTIRSKQSETAAQAIYWTARAKELRRFAAETADPEYKKRFIELADEYEQLACNANSSTTRDVTRRVLSDA